MVQADHDGIPQVLCNLGTNAIKFTPKGGRVRLRAEPCEGQARLSVADTGPGMLAEQLEHVFDQFWQADHADRRGVGLGLAIAKGDRGSAWRKGVGGERGRIEATSNSAEWVSRSLTSCWTTAILRSVLAGHSGFFRGLPARGTDGRRPQHPERHPVPARPRAPRPVPAVAGRALVAEAGVRLPASRVPVPTITVLSWNVEKLGEGKTTRLATDPNLSEIVPFIALVIARTGAELVGIMEINGGMGPRIRDWLVRLLNNVPGTVGAPWQGRLSTRQDGGTQEEYLYLWKEQPGRLVLDPASFPSATSLIGVVDRNLLAEFAQHLAWSPAQVDQLLDALAASGYINHPWFMERGKQKHTAEYRMVPVQWKALAAMAVPEVEFDPALAQPPAALLGPGGAVARQHLAQMLVDADILRFLTYGARSPYLANFLVGNPGKPLATAIYHAPGPQEQMFTIGPAINTIGMSLSLARAAAAGNVLVMGDFNVTARQMSEQVEVWGREKNGQPQFSKVTPVQRQQVFAPIVGGTLNAANLMNAGGQELRTTYVGLYQDDATAPDDVLLNAYDKFFFHGGAPPGGQPMTQTNEVEVINLALFLTDRSVYFDADLARSALTFFRVFCGDASLDKAIDALTRKESRARLALYAVQGRLRRIDDEIAQQNAAHGRRLPSRSTLTLRRDMLARNVAAEQARLNAAQAQVANARLIRTSLQNAATVFATGTGSAAAILRDAVSDHVPIVVQLTA